MANKRITSVRVRGDAGDGAWKPSAIERVTWLEDGQMFPRDEPSEKVARAVNAGEAYYVRTEGGDVRVVARLRHGTYTLEAVPAGAAPDAPAVDALATLPRY
ncbi:MAG: hypothetical protein R3B06_03255 [Kofleriaceae bacterium]